MKKNIKLVTLFGAICLMTSALTSCKLFGNNGKNDGPNVDENIDLNLDANYETKISLLIPNGNSNEETMINELIKEFNKDYPNITFEKNYISVSGYENTVRNQWIAGSLPDIVWSNSPDFYTLVGNEMALPLNTFIEKAGINLEEDYMKSYFDAGSVDGKYYCFPRSCDSVVTFINTKLLKQSGIDTSKIKNGWTWSDFTSVLADYRAYLDTTSNKNTYYCLDANLTGWLSVSYPILRSYGGEVIDDNQNILIDSPETRKALEMVKSLVDNKYIVASGLTSGNSYETGTSPFLFQSASISLYAERRALKDSVDIVSFPLIEDNNSPKIGSGIAGYCINSRVKDKKQVACWKFMEKMISYEGQQAMARGGLNLPSIRKDLQDPSTAYWCKGYENYNLSAYTYGDEYKITCDFLSKVETTKKAKLDEAVQGLFDDATRTDKTIDKAVSTCVKALKNALKN